MSNSPTQKNIDEAIEESFPASDSPAWTITAKNSKPQTTEQPIQKITLNWQRNTDDFVYESYNRDAVLKFGGGETLELSNPPQFFGDARFANSDELLLAALSFCYMQTLLAIASKNNIKIKSYSDNATAQLGKNSDKKICITEIHLQPEIVFEDEVPAAEKLQQLKESAHHHCFIANSVCSKIIINLKGSHA